MANKVNFRNFPEPSSVDKNANLFLIGYSGVQNPSNALYERRFDLNKTSINIFNEKGEIYIKDTNNKWHQIYIDGNDDDGYYFVIGNAIDNI